ncbi:50S ribosomal protein L21 [Candidatus Roizmanbacteria bacterium CG22_combo_CG10-13_8_21_14_all_35_9]|uniref:Large ribosomal subunit protein bL21 n=4 Tax=Candidatus Roizmaniibacteriota TaxID=1752723 RepID=A0A2M8F3Z6_9BACT|nr:MAG: 50S ribosomal protein L21 [Candidatus Roizmanbacteria bacterium CG23_combo_of_CG06-09_8_20_14_all_35_49]PIP62717.1 MAG: 50S ribosomal protein L21 [Candidatus Roizmanbacteria bacterium CG22_combo_CG10-13_8_21_14_all_35_9]PIY71455.1 MAG: 50S ribosomal protein L21 [Candidatus Roizmanbacteria bacterium CG_4_10_14_0_8_um_filter_35_28]PJC33970.1 MAG: 50S ribosomal protein L21 [Candidatus Roizmanbacteria bacterium CG_4_9_14_0_2_um_filter_35_15]PJC82886.1 MAG: 50S ribosomal protein L21 [Candida
MFRYGVVRTGGKQYLVKEGDLITVDRLETKEKDKIELETLARFDDEGKSVDLGTPDLTKKVQAEVVSHLKGDKIRVARFKAKVRYRRVKGFRPQLTTLKIIKI